MIQENLPTTINNVIFHVIIISDWYYFMYRKEFYNQSFECNFFNVSDTLIDLHYISRITGLQDDNRGYSVKYLSDNFVNEAGQCRSIIRTI